jgi:hypothetical protein
MLEVENDLEAFRISVDSDYTEIPLNASRCIMTLSSINSGAFPSPSLAAQQDLLQGRAQLKSNPSAANAVPPTADEKRQSALHLVTRTLTQAYDKIANRGVPSGDYNEKEPLTTTKAANTILGFIERRLQADVADGATQEQLKSRLDAGLEGFKKGFAEAAEQLKALSMLSPEIEADIGDTFKQVTSGIDALRSKFIEGAKEGVAPVTTKSSPAPAIKAPAQINNIAVQEGLYEYAEARDFRFELTTKEGDKVSIRASSSMGMSAAAGVDANGSYTNVSKSSTSNFSLSIEGDLNDDELNAINDLLGRVDKLAGQFYAGNLDDVFDKAVALGYDDQQITGYSLNLSQVQIQQVAVTYGAIGPEGAQSQSLANQLAPVGDFIKDVLSALDAADNFADPKKLLLDLSKKMADDAASKNEEPSELAKFLERILAVDLTPVADEKTAV